MKPRITSDLSAINPLEISTSFDNNQMSDCLNNDTPKSNYSPEKYRPREISPSRLFKGINLKQ